MEKGKNTPGFSRKREHPVLGNAVEGEGKIVENASSFPPSLETCERNVKEGVEDQRDCRFLIISSTISFSRGTRLRRASALVTA